MCIRDRQATVQLGKIAVQAIVNTMGVSAMAAFTAASRIDDFAYTPQQNIGHAMTTLMAQNRGAGKADRVRQGYHCGCLLYTSDMRGGASLLGHIALHRPQAVRDGLGVQHHLSLIHI